MLQTPARAYFLMSTSDEPWKTQGKEERYSETQSGLIENKEKKVSLRQQIQSLKQELPSPWAGSDRLLAYLIVKIRFSFSFFILCFPVR